MAIFFNFNMPKPKQFNYSPLYYDERKERLEQMKQAAEAENQSGYRGLQPGFLSQRREKARARYKLAQPSLVRVIIFMMLVLLLVMFMNSELMRAIMSGK